MVKINISADSVGPSVTGYCQVYWPVNNGQILLKGVNILLLLSWCHDMDKLPAMISSFRDHGNDLTYVRKNPEED